MATTLVWLMSQMIYVMSITDEIIPYYQSLLYVFIDELDIDRSFEDGTDPYQLKRALVEILLTLTMVREKALRLRQIDASVQEWGSWWRQRVFNFLEADEDGLIYLPKILVEVEIASSNGEARQLIDCGGIKTTSLIQQRPIRLEPAVLRKLSPGR